MPRLRKGPRVVALERYLQREGLSQTAFAEHLEVSQGLVWQWIEGRTLISAEWAKEIERLTEGKVKRLELLYPKERIA